MADNLGSMLEIRFAGSYFISKMEIQTGYDYEGYSAKDFRVYFYANDAGGWQRPKKVSITEKNGTDEQVATYDGLNFKMIGEKTVDLVITFDILEAHVIHFYVDNSYNGQNAVINEVAFYGPGKEG